MSDQDSTQAVKDTEDKVVDQPKDEKPTLTVEQLQRELAEVRREAAKYRTEKKAAENDKLSETEKLSKEVATIKSELLNARRMAIIHKYKLPEALADRLKGETVEDLEGDAKILADLLAPKDTEQSKDAPADPGKATDQTINPTNPTHPPRLTKEVLEKMSPAEINKNWEAVAAALSNKELK